MMIRLIPVLLTGIVLIANAPHSYSHEQTERFIPVGQSPGLSDKHTFIGTTETVNFQKKVLKVKGKDETRQVRFSAKTKIWMDRSKLKKSNTIGNIGKLKKGQRVEVKYIENKHKRDAEWIKIDASTP